MPVVVAANGKGGSGKTTSSIILAYTAAWRGASVSLIDCDPNQPHRVWLGTEKEPRASRIPMDYHFARDEEQLEGLVQQLKTQRQLVVVDLEGVANIVMQTAIQLADLVLVPMAPTDLDAREAKKALALVRQQSRILNRPIAHRAMFTDTDAKGPTKDERELIELLSNAGVPLLKTQLNRRSAFAGLQKRRLPPFEMDPKEISNLPRAIENAEAFADEVGELLRDIAGQRQAA